MRIGFIGCGNMGGALLRGLVKKNTSDDIQFLAHTRTKSRFPFEELGVTWTQSNSALAKEADLIVLAVKPAQAVEVLEEIGSELTSQKALLSLVAGLTLDNLEKACPNSSKLIRCMPNTPALVGKGIFALCFRKSNDEMKETLMGLLNGLGLAVEIPEDKFPAFSALIGAGPAYVFQMMHSLVQAGVSLGFSHLEARRLVVALFEGSACMAQESNEHLMGLRDGVLSPAGLSIAGVNVLDQKALTGTLIEAVMAAFNRSIEMEKAR